MTIQMNATEQYFPVVLLCCTRLNKDRIIKSDHSNESYRAVLSYGAVYYAV